MHSRHIKRKFRISKTKGKFLKSSERADDFQGNKKDIISTAVVNGRKQLS